MIYESVRGYPSPRPFALHLVLDKLLRIALSELLRQEKYTSSHVNLWHGHLFLHSLITVVRNTNPPTPQLPTDWKDFEAAYSSLSLVRSEKYEYR